MQNKMKYTIPITIRCQGREIRRNPWQFPLCRNGQRVGRMLICQGQVVLLLADCGRCPRRERHNGPCTVADRFCYAVGWMVVLMVHACLARPLMPADIHNYK